MTAQEKINDALDIAFQFGQIEGDHHRAWVIDQMVHVLCGTDEAYQKWVKEYKGPNSEYTWDTGIAP